VGKWGEERNGREPIAIGDTVRELVFRNRVQKSARARLARVKVSIISDNVRGKKGGRGGEGLKDIYVGGRIFQGGRIVYFPVVETTTVSQF